MNLDQQLTEKGIQALLSDLELGSVRYLNETASTNSDAAAWAEQAAPPRSLVITNSQTAGRGRNGRQWVTVPDAALAFSLILDPQAGQMQLGPLSALGALAVCQALQDLHGLDAAIKWPNDVLVQGKKLAGVLAEAQWMGDQLQSMILGIGINISPAAIDESVLPAASLVYPATCVEAVTGYTIDRWQLLHEVLKHLTAWLPKLDSDEFIQTWGAKLAFRGQTVQILADLLDQETLLAEGRLEGLSPDGSLELVNASSQVKKINFGEVRLRATHRDG